MEVLAVHATSVTVDPGEAVEWIPEQASETVIDGAIVAVTGIEPGDQAAVDIVTSAAATDLEALADEFGVETVVVVPSTHGQHGLSATPGPVLEAFGRALSCSAVVVPPHAYPELAARATAHPTAIQFRRYDGWLPGCSSHSESHWASPPERPTVTLQDAGLLAENDPIARTPAGQFLVDTLLDRTRNQALDADARLVSIRDQTGGPPAVPPADAAAQLHYGRRALPEGLRPELTCRVTDEADLLSRCRTLVSVLRGTLAVFEQPLQATRSRAASFDHHELTEVADEAFDPEARGDAVSLPEPVRFALTVGIEPVSGAIDDQPATALGRLVVASLDDTWVLQCAPLGRLGRTLAALFDAPRPVLPSSIAPTQLRLVPVGQNHRETCEDVIERLEPVRVDIDDRSLPVDQRLRTARQEGVPYYAVVGRREVDADTLSVTDRQSRTERQIAVESIVDAFPDLVEGDTRRRYGPRTLGDR